MVRRNGPCGFVNCPLKSSTSVGTCCLPSSFRILVVVHDLPCPGIPMMNRCGLPFVLGIHSIGSPADSPRGTMISSCWLLIDSADNFSVGVDAQLPSFY